MIDYFFRMGNIQIFQLIDRKKLHGEILPHIEKLMSINKNVRLLTKILVNRSIKHYRDFTQEESKES
jgi:hypothetical protein